MSSVIFSLAAELWQKMRTDYERYLLWSYNRAVEGTGGVLVNKAGRARHVDGLSLFTGNRLVAYKYASEELIEWWRTNPRLTLEQYEHNWMEGERSWHDT